MSHVPRKASKLSRVLTRDVALCAPHCRWGWFFCFFLRCFYLFIFDVFAATLGDCLWSLSASNRALFFFLPGAEAYGSREESGVPRDYSGSACEGLRGVVLCWV